MSLHRAGPRAARVEAGSRLPSISASRKNPIDTSIEIGKYLVSPLTKRLPDRRYAASVSIRSGQGHATHDRVLRLLPLFDSPHDALRFATEQGMAWLHERHGASIAQGA